MKYFLISFWLPEIIDLYQYERLVRASSYKKACELIQDKYPNATDFENLTI